MRNRILLPAALLAGALTGSAVYAQVVIGGTRSTSPTMGLKASSTTVTSPSGRAGFTPPTGALGVNVRPGIPMNRLVRINPEFFGFSAGVSPFLFPSFPVNTVTPVPVNPVNPVNPFPITSEPDLNVISRFPTGARPHQVTPSGPVTAPGVATNLSGQPTGPFPTNQPTGFTTNSGQPFGGFDQAGNPIASNNAFIGFDQFGNPVNTATLTPDPTNFIGFDNFGNFTPGLGNPFFGGVITTAPPVLPYNVPPAPRLPSAANALPTLGINRPGALRDPARMFMANRPRTRVRIVDGTVGSGRVVDGGDGTNLNYRTLMAHQSEVAPAAGMGAEPGTDWGGGGAVAITRPSRSRERMAQSKRDVNERVARAQSDQVFIEGGGPAGRASGTMIARNSGGITEKVAGSREEYAGSVMEVEKAPANTEQMRLVRRAESIMSERPLTQGRVVRSGATGIEVTYEVNGVYRTEVLPMGQVFFFKNGEMAAADTDPTFVRIGDQVLVPAGEPRQAVAGSREENRTNNTYIINGAGRSSSGAVKSKVAGSRQRARFRRPAR